MAEGTVSLMLIVLLLIGIAMFFSARFFLLPGAPRGLVWNPRKWEPIWKSRDRFRKPGFQLLISGYAIFAVAGLALVVMRVLGI